LNPQLIKSYMWQLMKSLDHMHKKGIFHRDIKPENILIESSTDIGRGLKLADFGSCRGIYSKQPYTEYISTRWYRAPECLLTDGYYGPEMDLWGAGCVMFEITSLYPLFPGSNEVDQISRIHKVLGTPSQEVLQKFKSKGASHISFDFPQQKGLGIPQLIPHAPADGVELMVKLLKYDASERISAREAMRHPYFRDIREQEARAGAGGVTQGGVASSAVATGGKIDNSDAQSVGSKGPAHSVGVAQGPPGGGGKGLPTIVGNGAAGSGQPALGGGNYQAGGFKAGPGQLQANGQLNASLPPIGGGGGGLGQPALSQQQQMQQQAMMQQQQQALLKKQMQQQQQQQQALGPQGSSQQTLTQQQQQQAARRRKKYKAGGSSGSGAGLDGGGQGAASIKATGTGAVATQGQAIGSQIGGAGQMAAMGNFGSNPKQQVAKAYGVGGAGGSVAGTGNKQSVQQQQPPLQQKRY
jgi:hypothetical protein